MDGRMTKNSGNCNRTSNLKNPGGSKRRTRTMPVEKVGIVIADKGAAWDYSRDTNTFGAVPRLVDWSTSSFARPQRGVEEQLVVEVLARSASSTPGCYRRSSARAFEPDEEGTRPGQAWAIAKGALSRCRDVESMMTFLDLAENVVLDTACCDLEQTGVEFEETIREKRVAFPHIFRSLDVERMIVCVARRFTVDATACLPTHVLQVVFGFVALPDSGVLCEVSKDFREAADEDGLWRAAYMERFEKPSGVNSTASPSGDEEDRWSVLVAHKGGGTGTARRRCGIPGGFKRRYMRRIQDPQVGDQVEVAWRGKFRLESLEVYNGMAWWLAQVVRKDYLAATYQVHYPGWEARWDEWVPRERLRWGSERRATALKGISPGEGDSVEMWCEGVHVPGAWLEAVVHGVKHGRLYLGEVLASGHFWVDPEHVRLVKQRDTRKAKRMGEDGHPRDRGSPSQRGAQRALLRLGVNFRACGQSASGSCSVM